MRRRGIRRPPRRRLRSLHPFRPHRDRPRAGRPPPARAGDGRRAAVALRADARGRAGVARRLRRAAGHDRRPRAALLRDVADGRRALPVRAAAADGRGPVVALRGKAGRPLLRRRVALRLRPPSRRSATRRPRAPGRSSPLAGVALAAPALLVALEVAGAATAAGTTRRTRRRASGARARRAPRPRGGRDGRRPAATAPPRAGRAR